MFYEINRENIKQFAYTNEKMLSGTPKGILIEFHGLNMATLAKDVMPLSRICSDSNILLLYPYDNPWSWMNDTAVKTVTEIVNASKQKYCLSEDVPIAVCGSSMGGLSALIYTLYSSNNIIACAANCPICDLLLHYHEVDTVSCTIYSAFKHYGDKLEDAIKTSSPIHQIDKMPKIPYLIIHSEEDRLVNIDSHSNRFTEQMLAKGYDVEYKISNASHGYFTKEYWDYYTTFLIRHL